MNTAPQPAKAAGEAAAQCLQERRTLSKQDVRGDQSFHQSWCIFITPPLIKCPGKGEEQTSTKHVAGSGRLKKFTRSVLSRRSCADWSICCAFLSSQVGSLMSSCPPFRGNDIVFIQQLFIPAGCVFCGSHSSPPLHCSQWLGSQSFLARGISQFYSVVLNRSSDRILW